MKPVQKYRFKTSGPEFMEADLSSTLAATIDTFPTLPTIANKILEVSANPKSSIMDLMAVIIPDQSLTATILKMANSAFFGQSRKVGSVEQALVVLGFQELKNLVIAKTVFNSFKKHKIYGKFEVSRYWEHAFLCGLAAKIIAHRMKKLSNELFVAGLLHDIGKLVIGLTLPVEFSQVIEESDQYFRNYAAEKLLLGTSHEEVGMKLLNRWMFPQNLIIAVGFHHQPWEAQEEPESALIVHLADLLAHISVSPPESNLISQEEFFNPEVIALSRSYGLDWNESLIAQLCQELAAQKEAEAGIFKLFFS